MAKEPHPLLIERLVPSEEAGKCAAAIPLKIPRTDLQKRRWRATAEDGNEVAFALPNTKLKHGDLLAAKEKFFRIQQPKEEVLAVAMPEDPTMAAKIGWYFGNRHIPIDVREDEYLVENFPTLTDSLTRIGIAYKIRQDTLLCPPHSEHRH